MDGEQGRGPPEKRKRCPGQGNSALRLINGTDSITPRSPEEVANGPLPAPVYRHIKLIVERGKPPRDAAAWELMRAHLDLVGEDDG